MMIGTKMLKTGFPHGFEGAETFALTLEGEIDEQDAIFLTIPTSMKMRIWRSLRAGFALNLPCEIAISLGRKFWSFRTPE
jgi:hypothetical protein